MAVSNLAASLPAVSRTAGANAHPEIDLYRPEFEQCPTHGRWLRNPLNPEGVSSWYADCPKCAIEKKSAAIMKRASIPPRFHDRTLGNYVAKCEGQARALVAAKDYAATWEESRNQGRNLILSGKVGTGKTHLAIGIARHVMDNNGTAVFVTVSEAIRAFRATWNKASDRTEDQVLADFSKPDLLIIDEVGVQYGTEAEQLVLFEIINRRYLDLKPMVIISNLPVAATDGEKTIQQFLGERAFDRLREGGGRLVVFDWESFRKSA